MGLDERIFILNILESLFLLSLAIAPPILIIYFIWKADTFNKEPIEKLIKAFLCGVASTFPSYVILNYVTMPSLENAFTQAFIGVGLVEEFFKFIPEFLPEEIKEEIWTKLLDTTMPSEIEEFASGIMNKQEMDKHNTNMKKLSKVFKLKEMFLKF